MEVEVLAGGSIAALDYRLQRLSLWNASGRFISTIPLRDIVGTGSSWPHDLAATDGGVFLKVSTWVVPEVRILRLAPVLVGEATVVATYPPDLPETSCRFCPIAVASNGDIAAATGGTLYGIVRIANGAIHPARWTRVGLPAAARDPEELARMNARAGRKAGVECGSPAAGAFSPYRPRFPPKSLAFDPKGRLWALPTVAEGDASAVLDILAPTGRGMTTLRLALRLTCLKIRGTALLAGGEDEDGEPVVYVFRIVG